ncbi:MAG: molybdate ABC transporter substrate-binding protein [Alphaproteobacteria bacterium]
MPIIRRLIRQAVVLAFALCSLAPRPATAEPVTVFAAASLTDALQVIGDAYAGRGGDKVRFSFASTSTLARQIAAGAPAQVFCAANVAWMDDLERRGLLAAGSRVDVAGNTLVLVAPKRHDLAPATIGAGFDLAARLGPHGRLALGDPAHVPAGFYAAQALRKLGMWDSLARRLAPADNVRAALALVARGEAPYGIVYATDAAISDQVAVVATFPADSHDPITYPCARITDEAGDAPRAFLAFLTGPEAAAIFARFGFRTGRRE